MQDEIIRSDLESIELTTKEEIKENASQSKVLDSGIDLMTSKEIQKGMPIVIHFIYYINFAYIIYFHFNRT